MIINLGGAVLKINETLLFILDSINSKSIFDDKVTNENIKFIHSLNLKCDCVGWCKIQLNEKTDQLLNKIKDFALQNKRVVRGWYEKKSTEFDSDFFILNAKYLSNLYDDYESFLDQNKNELKIGTIKAYKLPKSENIFWDSPLPIVSESFKEICIKNKLTGIDFYWIKDTGKYKAKQFFAPILNNKITEFACDKGLSYCNSISLLNKNPILPKNSDLFKNFQNLGGYLPVLSQIFYDLNVSLPLKVNSSFLPNTDFSYVYCNKKDYICEELILNKKAKNILLSEGAINQKQLTPIEIVEIYPPGYTVLKSDDAPYPNEDGLNNIANCYNAFLQKEKPIKNISEKECIALLKEYKRNDSKNFKKALAKSVQLTLENTEYACILPYYKIGSEILLNDEITLIDLNQSKIETAEYIALLEKEELHDEKIIGIVIAKGIDGDYYVLDQNKVFRINHEDMTVFEEWDCIHFFISEALENN